MKCRSGGGGSRAGELKSHFDQVERVHYTRTDDTGSKTGNSMVLATAD